MDLARQKRKEDINRDLAFIQSTLAYPEPDGYQDFLTQLVFNLLEEGNALFRDRNWEQAVKMFTEGLNVADYAVTEELHIPQVLLESLYVNRAAVYHSMGEYDRGVVDCDNALDVCKESHKALYRKALCLKELGKHREAYNCTTHPLLVSRPDTKVNELAQELAAKLGLKVRKPYVGAKEDSLITRTVSNGKIKAEAIKVSGPHVGNGLNPVSSPAPVRFPIMPQTTFTPTIPSHPEPAPPVVPDVVDTFEDSELIGDDLDSLLDSFPNETTENHTQAAFAVPSKTSISTHTAASVLPAPTPQLPPAFFHSPVSQISSLDSFSGIVFSNSTSTLDDLDDLLASGGAAGPAIQSVAPLSVALDSLDGLDSLDEVLDTAQSSAAENASVGELSLDELDGFDPPQAACDFDGLSIHVPKVDLGAVEPLDSLDEFPSADSAVPALPAVSIGGSGLDSLSDFGSAETCGSYAAAAPKMRHPKNDYKEKKNQALDTHNPLSSTHEFLQACSSCFPRKGRGIYTFVHKPDMVHTCKGDILLCRRKGDCPEEWTRVRPRPPISFNAQFVLCKELLKSGDAGICKYGEDCTFAFNQLEIDVWTAERKGVLSRKLLFELPTCDPVNSIIHLLQENKGIFLFLCQECFDNKPRIISKRSSKNSTLCSNIDVHHCFDANKCLSFVVRTHNVNYRKVRPLSLLCRLDLCRQAIWNACKREDCHFAHSVIELQTWKVQRDTGISPEEIVKVSTKYNEKQEQNLSKLKGKRVSSGNDENKPRGGGAGALKGPGLKMKFVCVQCLQGSNHISEPAKDLKYCSSKAKHPWIKERAVMLAKSEARNKWVQVRPLPHDKNFPQFYEICIQILKAGKCNYPGKCTFAHSQEEKEMWMYMKDINRPMEQMYDIWYSSLKAPKHQVEGGMLTQAGLEEKNIAMPTDYAEPMDGFHCRLCGKHCNSERQWQQHISTEKHKDRVFSCEGEDEALTWSYRFPGKGFELCPKMHGSCPDGVSCDYAHSPEELQEWTKRRDFLRQKLAKAREDMLVMPDEFDFGKYNFLLQD
ncbi:zinc finger CCCH domain-containing protein 7B-like [Xyrichtys novacula]|uniref:Zinc finger CCCH domain-containing protein 7B-like n=1 Tax=Xyrichtys novacula TaxID=13765 RepID=A0AAV1GQ44_XYRNO|nr:zinc finger CCCH domain-containing protein 7B-like [Xyrichtys novacula]